MGSTQHTPFGRSGSNEDFLWKEPRIEVCTVNEAFPRELLPKENGIDEAMAVGTRKDNGLSRLSHVIHKARTAHKENCLLSRTRFGVTGI